jgi:uncharacterized membrane protein YbhN (UPF0104 family)
MAVGLVGIWFDPVLTTPHLKIVIGSMFMGIVLLLLPFIIPTVADQMERVSRSLLFHLPMPGLIHAKWERIWEVIKAFHVIKKRVIMVIIGYSLVSHVLGIIIFYLLAIAIRIDIPFFVLGWIRSLVVIIQMVPVSIAGLGVREISLVFLMRDYGTPAVQAVSLSLLVFSVTVVAGTVGGLIEGWEMIRSGDRSGGVSSTG